MYWHGHQVNILIEPIYKPNVKRNCLIMLRSGEKLIVPRRALRKKGGQK